MEETSLEKLIAAHRAYGETRLRAVQSASSDERAATRLQRGALLKHLQTRVRLLIDARARMTERYDSEIGRHQQRINEIEQLLHEASGVSAVGTTAPSGRPEESLKAGPKKKKDRKAEDA